MWARKFELEVPMKTIFTMALFFTLSSNAQAATLIGRCSFDPQMTDIDKGDFRAGNVIANFYSVTGHGNDKRLVVATGISSVNGYISEKTDVVDGQKIDQGSSFPKYDVVLSNLGVPFQASWIDDEARIANPNPKKSIVGYDYPDLNQVRSIPANGSFLQNVIVGVPNAYPSCIFWAAPSRPS
jgi:hypothetical protein